jgi:hypothetical protein
VVFLVVLFALAHVLAVCVVAPTGMSKKEGGRERRAQHPQPQDASKKMR